MATIFGRWAPLVARHTRLSSLLRPRERDRGAVASLCPGRAGAPASRRLGALVAGARIRRVAPLSGDGRPCSPASVGALLREGRPSLDRPRSVGRSLLETLRTAVVERGGLAIVLGREPRTGDYLARITSMAAQRTRVLGLVRTGRGDVTVSGAGPAIS